MQMKRTGPVPGGRGGGRICADVCTHLCAAFSKMLSDGSVSLSFLVMTSGTVRTWRTWWTWRARWTPGTGGTLKMKGTTGSFFF